MGADRCPVHNQHLQVGWDLKRWQCPSGEWWGPDGEGGLKAIEAPSLPPARASAPSAIGHVPTPPTTNGTEPWTAPAPLARRPVPPLPPDPLPPALWRFASGLATMTQTPPDFALLLCLCAVGAAVAGRVHIVVREGWEEPPNLYGVGLARSGERKSALPEEVSRPLLDWQAERVRRLAGAVAEAEARREVRELRLAELKRQCSKAQSGERAGLEDAVAALARELAEERPARLPRLLADDVTPERLATLMAENDGRMAILSAEGGEFLDILAGRYSEGRPNIGLVLKAHRAERHVVDRGSRPGEVIERPALTLGLLAQPDVLVGLMEPSGRRRGAGTTFRGRGLLARPLYVLPPSLVGRRAKDAPPLDAAAREGYARLMLRLLDLEPHEDSRGERLPHPLYLSDAARAALLDFGAELEPQLGERGELESIADWAGKLLGAIARLAGLLHCAAWAEDDRGRGSPWDNRVSSDTMAAAIALGRYFLGHALAAFDLMGSDPATDAARGLVRWLEVEQPREFTRRDAFNAHRGRFKTVDDLDAPLSLLEAHGYIRRQEPPERPLLDDGKRRRGRAPSPTYDVNPLMGSQNTQITQNGRSAWLAGLPEHSARHAVGEA